MDCLPEASEWSAQSQYLMLQDHLQALQFHLQQLEAAPDALTLLQELPHLAEINARSLEAHTLLQALGRHPHSQLQNLKPDR